MSITLNHTIVRAHDLHACATFIAGTFDLPVPPRRHPGPVNGRLSSATDRSTSPRRCRPCA
jgi:hypothetical protein